MKKGTVIEGTIRELHFPDKGILPQEEGLFVVKNTLPGQKVRAAVRKSRNGKGEAVLLEVLEPSPMETAAGPCPHFGICGGCLYQTVPYETQLALKEEQVRRLLTPVLGADLPMEPILGSPLEKGYRNKMEFSFGDAEKGGPLTLGMHRRGSFYDVISVEHCRIMDGDFRMILSEVLAYMKEKQLPYYHKMTRSGILRHLLVRKAAATGEILVDLITTSAYHPEADLTERLLALPLAGRLTGILHTVNDSPADAVADEGTEVLYGQSSITEELLGLRFRITPFSFFQTNSSGAEVLYSLVRDWVGETSGKVIYDLYSGTGTIAQILAPVAEEVVGVEIVEEAVGAARENAELNGLSNCRFLAGDVLQVLDGLPQAPDILVLDPPRDGIHPKALPKLLRYGTERVVLISCKPTSLARDLPAFLDAGYQVERIRCVDMFPQTGNVETVCCLYHQKKDFISAPCELKDADHLTENK